MDNERKKSLRNRILGMLSTLVLVALVMLGIAQGRGLAANGDNGPAGSMAADADVPQYLAMPALPAAGALAAPAAEWLPRPSEEQLLSTALLGNGVRYRLSYLHEALNDETLVAQVGEHRAWPDAGGEIWLGQGSLLAWQVLEEENGAFTLNGAPVQGIGGRNFVLVVGLEPDGAYVCLMDAQRQLHYMEKEQFYQRVQAAGVYARVDAALLDVPYLSQIENGLLRGCEITSIAMMVAYAMGPGAEVPSLQNLVARMVYSTDGTPATGYVGSPYYDGWTTAPAPQLPFVAGMIGSAIDLSGTETTNTGPQDTPQDSSSISRIRAHLAAGVPVVVWFEGYHLGYGDYSDTGVTHCMVLTGYDEEGFFLHDPWNIDPNGSYENLHYTAGEVYGWMAGHGFWALSY